METSSHLSASNKRSHGQLTADIGKNLELKGYDVLYDRGVSKKSGEKIVSYFGDQNEGGTQLSYLDIAIVERNTNKAVALIEIEETANRPKTIIGDIFAFLMGERVVFQGRELELGNWTTLIVLGYSKSQHLKHSQYILEKMERAKSVFGTRNCEIGNIVIETYSESDKIISVLKSLVENKK